MENQFLFPTIPKKGQKRNSEFENPFEKKQPKKSTAELNDFEPIAEFIENPISEEEKTAKKSGLMERKAELEKDLIQLNKRDTDFQTKLAAIRLEKQNIDKLKLQVQVLNEQLKDKMNKATVRDLFEKDLVQKYVANKQKLEQTNSLLEDIANEVKYLD